MDDSARREEGGFEVVDQVSGVFYAYTETNEVLGQATGGSNSCRDGGVARDQSADWIRGVQINGK